MNQKEKIVEFFKRNNYSVTLGQLLSDPSGIGYKCTSRFSDLRKDGYQIICEKGKRPSDNLYRMIWTDDDNQRRFA